MSLRFSVLDRKEIIDQLQSEQFDVLVIGGGITGAGIALDAASRGLKTALVEKSDFASGTSSRSTKLIHGGLRYLKQLEFGLVKEVGSERAVVHHLAPHLVVPEKMLLPLSEGKSFGYWLTSLGLMIYDWLAGVKKEDQRKMLTRLQSLRYEPLLRKENIKGGAIYAEYRTDDARLTLEIAKTAFQHNASILNYIKVVDFLYHNERITGVCAIDELSGTTVTIQSRVVVNATGPWVDELREINRSKEGKWLYLTKGVHIVVPYDRFPIKQAIYFDADDGRMIFAIPRGRITYIGTTDTSYTESKEEVHASREDAVYLLNAVNKTFTSVLLTQSDIESSWAGLRPLIFEEGKSATELSRKDEIFQSASGLISIAGGKLTGYRKMAERVIDLVMKQRFTYIPFKKCFTDTIQLTGGVFSGDQQVKQYTIEVKKRLNLYHLPAHTARYLVNTYGKQTEIILLQFEKNKDSNVVLSLLRAELWFCVHHEMIATLQDFLIRRTGSLFFNIHLVRHYKDILVKDLTGYFQWDAQQVAKELMELHKAIQKATLQ